MHFKSVKELIQSSKLSDEDKLKALRNWKSMCELEKASTAEGMPGERTSPIADILKAIRELEGE